MKGKKEPINIVPVFAPVAASPTIIFIYSFFLSLLPSPTRPGLFVVKILGPVQHNVHPLPIAPSLTGVAVDKGGIGDLANHSLEAGWLVYPAG